MISTAVALSAGGDENRSRVTMRASTDDLLQSVLHTPFPALSVNAIVDKIAAAEVESALNLVESVAEDPSSMQPPKRSLEEVESVYLSPSVEQRLPKRQRRSVMGKWTEEEDSMLEAAIKQTFIVLPSLLDDNGNRLAFKDEWAAVSNKIPGRKTAQCRYRWKNHLSPDVNKAPLTQAEEHLLLETAGKEQLGRSGKWTELAGLLPGRTASMVRNFFGRRKRLGKSQQGL